MLDLTSQHAHLAMSPSGDFRSLVNVANAVAAHYSVRGKANADWNSAAFVIAYRTISRDLTRKPTSLSTMYDHLERFGTTSCRPAGFITCIICYGAATRVLVHTDIQCRNACPANVPYMDRVYLKQLQHADLTTIDSS
jgi:hypothetical protein